MSSAREIIAAAASQYQHIPDAVAVTAINGLKETGFRILAPDELDPATVERCAHTAWLHAKQGATPSQIEYVLRTLTGGNNGR